jgi:hypothetical protein
VEDVELRDVVQHLRSQPADVEAGQDEQTLQSSSTFSDRLDVFLIFVFQRRRFGPADLGRKVRQLPISDSDVGSSVALRRSSKTYVLLYYRDYVVVPVGLEHDECHDGWCSCIFRLFPSEPRSVIYFMPGFINTWQKVSIDVNSICDA